MSSLSSPAIVGAKALASTSVASTSASPELGTTTINPQIPEVHQAAQRGDLTELLKLLEKTPSAASSLDAQGISPLHWAAINGQLLACKMLLEKGAIVDQRGGDLDATPLQWAARNGHLYVVHLLLKYSADPTLLDSQSFNSLHLAVHSSAALLLAYILFTLQPVAVDSTDTEGHTGLHWACYQGDAISVDLLLRAGADPRRADEAGLTPLHWAAVKGNSPCIKRLMEAGADISKKEKLGKTAKDMATELKSLAAYKRGLQEAGFDEDGRRMKEALSPKKTIIAIFIVPTIAFILILNTLAVLPWWSGLLLASAEFFGMHHIISKVLLNINSANTDRLTKSPYLCSIICASIVSVVYVWGSRFVYIKGFAGTNLLCIIAIMICTYNFFRAITLDPGHVPLPNNDAEMKEMIEDLVEVGSFNGSNFCLSCMTRRPLRSKHSFASKRCTARFDHVCPWVWNDVGVNNHRQFLLFVFTMVVSIGLFIRLAIAYYTTNAPPLAADVFCILPTPLCAASHYDNFALSVVFWSALQLSWTIILLGAQLWQIARQLTTLEVSNLGRYGFMGGKTSANSQQGLVDRWNADRLAATEEDHEHGPNCDHSPKPTTTRKGKGNFLLKILGIDRFTNGKAAEGLAKATKGANPFDLGIYINCLDFWKGGRELEIDYSRLYEIPSEGFEKRRKERRRKEKEEKALGGGSKIMGISTRRNGNSNASYERVAMDEV